jgi:hypothetical protein
MAIHSIPIAGKKTVVDDGRRGSNNPAPASRGRPVPSNDANPVNDPGL